MNDLRVSAGGDNQALFLFGAMFDEVDESTAMMKAVSTADGLPTEGEFLYMSIDDESSPLPSDFYLSLAGRYTLQFNQGQTQALASSSRLSEVKVIPSEAARLKMKADVEQFQLAHNQYKLRCIS
mgnify:CR=1 FL=1